MKLNTRREFMANVGLGAVALAASRKSFAADESALLKRAEKLLAQAPFIDTHNDLPSMIIELAGGDVAKYDLSVRHPELCADVPAMRAGRLGAQYWSVYVDSSTQERGVALHEGLRQFDVVARMIRATPAFEQAHSAADIERISRAGKLACLVGVEGGHLIELSPAVLRVFFDLGARYLTLTHFGNVPWADSATDRPEQYGLTDLGRQLVREMNRLGMFADLSHVSADTMRDVLKVTRAPVLFSHSNAFALTQHPRNVPDDVLRSLRDNGGVIHVNFIRGYVSPHGKEWLEQRAATLRELHSRLVAQADIDKAVAEWEKSNPGHATIGDMANHIDHIREVAGVDHIGIGADFFNTNANEMVEGLANVTQYPDLFAELLKRGYSDADILKIAGRNHLRAMHTMEEVAAGLQRTETPLITEPARAP